MKTPLMRLLFMLPFATIIIAKILNWVIGFNDSTNELINQSMFIFIGICYIIYGFALDQMKYKVTLIVCGLFLISMNFLPKNNYMIGLGVMSIVIPWLIGKFLILKKPSNSAPNQ